jgi:hypothetical protein
MGYHIPFHEFTRADNTSDSTETWEKVLEAADYLSHRVAHAVVAGDAWFSASQTILRALDIQPTTNFAALWATPGVPRGFGLAALNAAEFLSATATILGGVASGLGFAVGVHELSEGQLTPGIKHTAIGAYGLAGFSAWVAGTLASVPAVAAWGSRAVFNSSTIGLVVWAGPLVAEGMGPLMAEKLYQNALEKGVVVPGEYWEYPTNPFMGHR